MVIAERIEPLIGGSSEIRKLFEAGKEMAERVKYATYLGSKFKEYNTTGLWWMGLLNRSASTWYEDAIVTALFDAKK